MFLKELKINNFRAFKNNFQINNFNIPNNNDEGSGITIIVGENGCGKTTILDAIALTMLDYKADNIKAKDFNDTSQEINISFNATSNFEVKGLYPNSKFESLGFIFKASFRKRSQGNYYHSPIVTDLQYIPKKPEDFKKGAPDLRVSVNNPYYGKRYNETDLILIDKNRLYQSKSGTFNDTKFDRIMNDFNFQYNKSTNSIIDLNNDLNLKVKKDKISNTNLENTIKEFFNISNEKVQLDFLNNYNPYENAKFVVKKNNNLQIPISELGSGYEMIFSLIYSYYMSIQNTKDFIILIDEPELHLHPKLQQKFVDFLIKISKNTQIIITTHSPLLVKQFSYNKFIKTVIIDNTQNIKEIGDRKLPYISVNETNFLAFDLATEEYHNELYEELMYVNKEKFILDFDKDFLVNVKGEIADSPYKNQPNRVTKHTFIRNQIHHRKDNGAVSYDELEKSIKILRTYL